MIDTPEQTNAEYVAHQHTKRRCQGAPATYALGSIN
jgi:hypothetical protein